MRLRGLPGCCELRDALEFGKARDAAKGLGVSAGALDLASQQLPEIKALVKAAKSMGALCDKLSSEQGTDAQVPQFRVALVAELFTRAEQEIQSQRRNHAALLLYRALELALSESLRIRWGVLVGVECETELERVPERVRPGDLLDRLAVARRAVGAPSIDLRYAMGQISQVVLLVALGDPSLGGTDEERVATAKAIKGFSTARNDSIFAHGVAAVDAPALEAFRDVLFNRKERKGLLQRAADKASSDLLRLLNELRGPVLSEDGRSVELQP